ncbi:hypothetical protein C8Q79DRAFT_500506 [Trametes meyenii]|nr:hypothetical protein C8Q79DRAFT_500506 [Trametes meyenii]
MSSSDIRSPRYLFYTARLPQSSFALPMSSPALLPVAELALVRTAGASAYCLAVQPDDDMLSTASDSTLESDSTSLDLNDNTNLTIVPPPLLSDTILAYLATNVDLPTLYGWKFLSAEADRVATIVLNHRYHSLLANFLNDPAAFRNIMRISGAVISGSAALNFCDVERAHAWSPQDLDVYVPHHAGAGILAYLINVEHYIVDISAAPKYPYDHPGFSKVIHLKRGSFEIDLIQSVTRSALHPLPFFWGTHVMNYVGADSFCVAYPEHTLQGQAFLNPIQLVAYLRPTLRILANKEKYTLRGYTFRRPLPFIAPSQPSDDTDKNHTPSPAHTTLDPHPLSDCVGQSACPCTIRYFGDEFCFMGSFRALSDSRYVERPLVEPSRTVRWWCGGPPCGTACVNALHAEKRIIPGVSTIRSADVFTSLL